MSTLISGRSSWGRGRVVGEAREMIRAGVAGAGVFGGYHAQKYARCPGAALTAVYDRDPARAANLAEAFGAQSFSAFDAFLSAIDAVSIATPAAAHADLAHQALAAGKHCLIEKPIAMDLAAADALVATAARRALVLQVGHQERFVAAAGGVFQEVGDVRRLSFERLGPPSGRCEDVSVVFDLMVHDLDLARRFEFGEPSRVEAVGDEHAVKARLWFSGGREIALTASRRAAIRRRQLGIERINGRATFDFHNRAFIDINGRPESDPVLNDPLAESVENFVASITGAATPLVSGADGRGALDWALSIEQARLSGLGGAEAQGSVLCEMRA